MCLHFAPHHRDIAHDKEDNSVRASADGGGLSFDSIDEECFVQAEPRWSLEIASATMSFVSDRVDRRMEIDGQNRRSAMLISGTRHTESWPLVS